MSQIEFGPLSFRRHSVLLFKSLTPLACVASLFFIAIRIYTSRWQCISNSHDNAPLLDAFFFFFRQAGLRPIDITLW